VQFFPRIGNRSNQPAFHTLVKLLLDTELTVTHGATFQHSGSEPAPHNNWFNIYSKVIGTPPYLPVFKELEFGVCDTAFSFVLPAEHINREMLYQFGYEVATPGYIRRELGTMRLVRRSLTLQIKQG
jgi:hypothetical protein